MNKQVSVMDREPSDLAVTDSASLMAVISRAASDPAVDVSKLERLMALYERIEAKNAEQAFNTAMTSAQTEMRPIAADASNSQTKSHYASYRALDKVMRPIYTKHGFSLSFDTGDNASESCVKILCYVSHNSGHSRTYHIDMPADGKGAKGGDVMTRTHATGAASSYGIRYLLRMIFNVSIGDYDDDGNSASDMEATISSEQLATLQELVAKFDADIEKFVKYLGVGALAELKQKDYRRAIEALNIKGKTKK